MHWWELLLLVVGLMSGALALVREAFSLYFPNQTETDAKKRFWACVRIAFILAGSMLWYDEHAKVVSLSDDKPRFTATLREMAMITSRDWPPDRAGILLVVSIANSGSPSVVQDFALDLVDHNGQHVHGMLFLVPHRFTVGGTTGDKAAPPSFGPEDAIYEKTKEPLVRGSVRTGVITAWFNRAQFETAARPGGPTLELSFGDYLGARYKFSDKMGTNMPEFKYFPGGGGISGP